MSSNTERKYAIPLKGKTRPDGVQTTSRGVSDIPNRMLRADQKTIALSGKQYMRKLKKGQVALKDDPEKEKPLSVASAKVQAPDLDCNSFQRQALDVTVPAGVSDYTVLTLEIKQRVRGVLKRYGWYTTNPGAPNLEFGLYVGGTLVAPGGPKVDSQPRTQNEFQPSGLSIDFDELSVCHHPVEPNTKIEVKVNNLDGANAYSTWAHVWGWLWLEELREAGKRAYINEATGEII